jgi:prephenate dehydrogenase
MKPLLRSRKVVTGADMVVVCTPVGLIVPTIKLCLQWLPEQCVVTDVGSVKSGIVHQATDLLDGRFVGGHPMAGSEQTGVQNARADLFEGTAWALTPTEKTAHDALQRVTALAEGVGARVLIADPDEHDRAVALTSHLPHALALALVHVAENMPYPQLIGGSFRDGTRVAASSPELWRDIFLHNREHVLWAIDEFAWDSCRRCVLPSRARTRRPSSASLPKHGCCDRLSDYEHGTRNHPPLLST